MTTPPEVPQVPPPPFILLPPSSFEPLGPKVRCDFLPLDFLSCAELVDHKGNKTMRDKLGYGCLTVSVTLTFDLVCTKFGVNPTETDRQ
jgi:hypothetical protein